MAHWVTIKKFLTPQAKFKGVITTLRRLAQTLGSIKNKIEKMEKNTCIEPGYPKLVFSVLKPVTVVVIELI